MLSPDAISSEHKPSATRLLLAGAMLLCVATNAARADDGDFYKIAADRIAGPPGTLLKAEPVPAPPGAAAAYRIVYRSRGLANEAIAVSGVVALPAAGMGARPVIAWGHGTTGVATDCAPSLAPARDFSEIAGLQALLAKGYIVAATDYQGLGEGGQHPYLAGPSEAHSMIDAARAARRLPGARAGTRFAAWGFSQGGHAALFTGALARRYAPELQLAGVAAVSAPTDLDRLLRADIHSTAGEVLTSYAAWSWSRSYRLPIRQIIKSKAITDVQRVASTCNLDLADDLTLGLDAAGFQGTGLLKHGADRRPDWNHLITGNSVPPPGDAPVFIAQGVMDQIVQPGPTRAYVNRLCRAGLKVDYVEIPWASHGAAETAGTTAAVAWLSARLSGQPSTSTCTDILAKAGSQ
ncbi:alpha-beta hydrolase superfamily lysophospholipase [Angulomicrobium tetraedrale]|uniref:Alpha-beta hydrolase superfamily lysophospholipase n=1 Tax=Ancylobacter tetraedralis TaxID=217068 RepID=A0A839Z3Z3_9HYPH|nr:lipase family protein [Ancylobacter tetraedralis]MBB3771404.1 alpha-beta hydrolase superfamily lysophospholipase [Ancylobacter tetraedralis]